MTHIWRSPRRAGTVVLLSCLVALAPGCAAGGDLVAYDLPPEPHRYTLEVTTQNVTTVWEYTSQRPAGDDSVQPCLEEALGDPEPQGCRPEPLIFLRYELGLDLDNTVPARRPHEITVTGYYQPRLAEMPELTELSVEASFDDGTTWRSMPTGTAREAGTFTATIRHRDAGAGDPVTLRISALDSEGNTVVQTIPEAYRLR